MSEAINNGGLEEKKEVTTAEHFEWFKNEANYWLKRFGLYGWQVRFLHEDNDNTRDCRACIAYKMESRLAVITLLFRGMVRRLMSLMFAKVLSTKYVNCCLLVFNILQNVAGRNQRSFKRLYMV